MATKSGNDVPQKPQGGRPRGSRQPEPGSAVMTWLRVSEHERLIQLAQQQDTSISSLVRQFVIGKLR